MTCYLVRLIWTIRTSATCTLRTIFKKILQYQNTNKVEKLEFSARLHQTLNEAWVHKIEKRIQCWIKSLFLLCLDQKVFPMLQKIRT